MKEKVMYAVYRSPKAKFPDSIQQFYKDADWIVHTWKQEGYEWAKEAYVKRVHMTFLPEARIDIRSHEYKTIKI